MTWTDEDKKALLEFKGAVDSDDIHVKEKIKQVLLNNKFIIHALNNQELEAADSQPDDYFYVNILPYYIIPETQTKTKNFLCYEISYKELNRYNSAVKNLQIVFYILCHNEDIKDLETGIARHDLLAALVQDQFNFSNYFGRTIQLVSDIPATTDTDYATRTLTFEQITDNNLVKSRNIGGTTKVPMLSNKVQINSQSQTE